MLFVILGLRRFRWLLIVLVVLRWLLFCRRGGRSCAAGVAAGMVSSVMGFP